MVIERERVKCELSSISGVEKVFDSDANFLLVRVKEADLIYQKLSNKGVIVRNRSKEILCSSCLRITIGSKKENQLMLEYLKEALSEL